MSSAPLRHCVRELVRPRRGRRSRSRLDARNGTCRRSRPCPPIAATSAPRKSASDDGLAVLKLPDAERNARDDPAVPDRHLVSSAPALSPSRARRAAPRARRPRRAFFSAARRAAVCCAFRICSSIDRPHVDERVDRLPGKPSGSGSKLGSSSTSLSKTSFASGFCLARAAFAPRYMRESEMSGRSFRPLFGSSSARSSSSASVQLRAMNAASPSRVARIGAGVGMRSRR